MDKLRFGIGNAKLSQSIATFSLPAGHSCPFAKRCLSKANRKTGTIEDGKHCQFRCFAASQESTFPSIRLSRWHNFDILRDEDTAEEMANIIQQSLPRTLIVRIHVGGDFFSEKYFVAWLNVALNNPSILFYGYTKAVPFLAKYKKYIPANFRFTASRGGTHDYLISKHNLKYAEVVLSLNEAKRKGLEIDHDDSQAMFGIKSFGLLIHGTQPPNTEAGKALVSLIRRGIGGYGHSPISRNRQPNKEFKIFVTIKNKPVRPSYFFTRKSIYV